MLDRRTARLMTLAGSAAALLSGLGSLLIAFFPAFNPAGLGAALLLLGLAVGIYLDSRICAVAALLYFVAMRFAMYSEAAAVQAQQGGNVMMGFWFSVLLLTSLYAVAVIGTFITATLPPAAPRTIEESGPAASVASGLASAAASKPKRTKVPRVRSICSACAGSGKLPDTALPCAWCDGNGYV
jgi:hypothetical protein